MSELRQRVRVIHRASIDDSAKGSRGFTLIELLVVIAVISMLAGLVAPNVFKHVSTARDVAAQSQIEALSAALDAYRLDNGMYPTTQQGLQALRVQPEIAPVPTNWRGPYIRKNIPLDPWRNAYVYRSPGEIESNGYELLSYGADGQPGGEGDARDIKSWSDTSP